MIEDRPFIPYGRQLIEDDDIVAVADVLKSDFLTTGPVVEAFENKLTEITGAAHAVSCSSGTSALHLAAMALNLGPGDHVVVSAMTFLATANAARYVGAEVTFADVDPDSGLITPDTLTDALERAGSKAKAVFPVHINGQAADMIALRSITTLPFVEDACHALGGAYEGPEGTMVPVGSCVFSDMATFSFHPVKTVAMGEGGALTTNNADLAHRLRRLRNIGMTREVDDLQEHAQALDSMGNANPWYYEMPELGFNYRASAIHCALGLSQLGKLNQFVAHRDYLMAQYRDRLKALAPVVRPVLAVPRCRPSWHICVVFIDFAQAGTDRAAVMRALATKGIGTQVHYLPVNRQPYYRQRYGETTLTGADAYYERILTLPLQVGMTSDDVDYVLQCLTDVLGAGG